jgi:hypothetical protein
LQSAALDVGWNVRRPLWHYFPFAFSPSSTSRRLCALAWMDFANRTARQPPEGNVRMSGQH